ncbi:MAG TPA: hypothetical protein VMR31_09725 [Myxococcota bacterium]|nr:hypothetical protein [Myxococcota bacterium]
MSATEQAEADEVGAGALGAALALYAVGGLARLVPLLDIGGRLFRQFPTEDGYLMLTIARNIALGHGMSVSGGLQPTNGTQPLATLLWAGVFELVGGDRRLGVLGVQLLEATCASIAAWLLWRLARRIYAGRPRGGAAALLVSAAWFASPIVVMHSMNCLESGLYALLIVSVLLVFADSGFRERWSWTRCTGAGALLGAAFWARNDAVFLVLGACIAHASSGFGSGVFLRRRFAEATVIGSTSVAVAVPWLVFNQLRFGAIVPISGRSEAMESQLGENLAKLPSAVFEYATLYLPIPSGYEESPWVVAGACLSVLALAGLAHHALRSRDPIVRSLATLGSIFAVCLLAFYGMSFGAGYFMSRYMFALSPLLALLVGAVARRGWVGLASSELRWVPGAFAAGLVLLASGLDARLYAKGTSHMHFQVVDWVQKNVSDDTWVAAPQSGTLGFFHDRTVNLDGKVNPVALAARSRGEVDRYLVESREIQYLADWEGLAAWAKQPVISTQFELVVDDPEHNLAVLRRRAVASGS